MFIIKGQVKGVIWWSSRRERWGFYSMFSEFSALIVSTAKLFVFLGDPKFWRYEVKSELRDTLRWPGRKDYFRLGTSFITPFDREVVSSCLAYGWDCRRHWKCRTSACMTSREMRQRAVQVAHLILASEELQKAFDRLLISQGWLGHSPYTLCKWVWGPGWYCLS